MASSRFPARKNGNRVNITLTSKEYKKLLEDLEELESIRAYDAAKSSGETPIPFERAIQQIERSRK